MIDLVRRHVCADSYSSSAGWLGYCERRCRYADGVVREAVSALETFFKPHTERIGAVTSLYRGAPSPWGESPRRPPLPPRAAQLLRELTEEGYLRKQPAEDFVSPADALTDDEPYAPQAFADIGWHTAARLAETVMSEACSPIRGHCFLVLEPLGLIAYPHEDTGFGFIATTRLDAARDRVGAFFRGLDRKTFFCELRAR